jgi:HEPN domain-containing protein
VNRTELQKLAEDRLLDAKALLDAGRWSGAYYLAGYAVECALKSCILSRIERTGFIFEDKEFAEKCWTHNVKDLVSLADLQTPREIANEGNPELRTNWSIVESWSEISRSRETDEITAKTLYNAVINSTDGVLPWLRNHW